MPWKMMHQSLCFQEQHFCCSSRWFTMPLKMMHCALHFSEATFLLLWLLMPNNSIFPESEWKSQESHVIA
jgi:hypothetical protein